MQVTLTAKVKILPDDIQAGLLEKTLQAYTDACNHVSGFVLRSRSLSLPALNNALYRELRDKFGLRSQMAQSVLKTVVARYKTVLANEGKWLNVSFKNREYDLVWNRDYSMATGLFSVNTLEGRIKVPFCAGGMEKYFDGVWRFGTAKLVFRKGKWYLHIPMSKEYDVIDDSDVSNITGVDLGVNFLATSYDSEGNTSFYSGKRSNTKGHSIQKHVSNYRKEVHQAQGGGSSG